MGRTAAALFAALSLPLVACGGGGGNSNPDSQIILPDSPAADSPTPDSPVTPDSGSQYDFSCYGQPFPTTAPAHVTVSGIAETLSGTNLSGVPDVMITTYAVDGGAQLDTTTSGSDGTFTTAPLATGDVPLTAYAKAQNEQYLDTYVYPPVPLAADLSNVPLILLTPTLFGELASFAGATQETGNGAIFLLVTDCANTQLSDPNVTVQQDGTSVGTQFPLGQLAGSQFSGAFVQFDVPPGDTDITVRYGTNAAMTFPVHTVGSYAGSMTITIVRPGP